MDKLEKWHLRNVVIHTIKNGLDKKEMINTLEQRGYKRATIKKYFKALEDKE